MIQDSIFVCGGGLLSHPVTYLFHLGVDVATGHPDPGALEGKRLVVADCRIAGAGAGELATWTAAARDAGVPLLLLCPSTADLDGLASVTGAMPSSAAAAVLVAPLPGENGDLAGSYVHALAYTQTPGPGGRDAADSAAAASSGSPAPSAGAAVQCACTDLEVLSTTFVDPGAAERFKADVEAVMCGWRPAVTAPPTGLKYVHNVFAFTLPFTYSYDGTSNGAGSVTIGWSVWGFLNQSPSQTSQYLVVEGSYQLAAGSLHADSSCDRGFGNTYFGATTTAPAPLSGIEFMPASGENSFSGSFDLTVNYKQPTGGYGTWDYTDTITDAFSGWAVKSTSSGAALGGYWWMTTPCNGSNVSDTWKDAFDFWGHVHSLSGPSTGTLTAHDLAVWTTTQLITGNVAVSSALQWQGARFFGSSCSPGVYWKINAAWNWFSNSTCGFTMDFTPLNPA